MRFNIPQFVTIEDKILVGPIGITIRQLFLLFGAFLISYGAYKILPGSVSLVIVFLSFSLAIILGWLKINNKYIINFLPKLIKILISNRKYIWQEEIEVMNKITKIPEIQKYIHLLEEELSKEEKIGEQKLNNISLAKLLQFAHKHGYNPKDPYLNFPLPKFPKK
ncbi:MAG: PrgI family protein [Patescibacteria group bacterium]|nr:PrgI family protein [Patescibacteria group bacterium]